MGWGSLNLRTLGPGNWLQLHMDENMNGKFQYLDKKIIRDSSQSLFSQLEEILREGIEDGIWEPGEPIPSERELSRVYEMSRMTVRKAIDRLVTAGFLYRVDGKGTFVAQPKVSYRALTLAGLREQTLKLGYSPSTKLLGIERVLPSETVARNLKITTDKPVFLIERVVYANDIPLALHRSFIPESICPTLAKYDLNNLSLYSVLKETTLASVRESLLLGVEPGSPMFLLRITTFDNKTKPVEYVKVIFRGDRVQLSLDV